MSILAVGGFAYAGKDAFVDALETHRDYKRTFMSKPLMKALLTLDPIISIELLENLALLNQTHIRYSLLHEIVGYADSKMEPEVRRLLQVLGTEVGRRMFKDTLWIDLIISEVTSDKSAFWGVTGIRFENELEGFKHEHAISVWINRPGVEPVNTHVSDNTLGPDDFDYVVDNDGTLDDLAKKAISFHDQHVISDHNKRYDQPLFTKPTATSKEKS